MMKSQPKIMFFTALLSGLVFGIGLILAGMANPAKVIGFLDIAGAWDPSLAFVMIGAIGIGVFAFSWAKKHQFTLLNQAFTLPNTQKIDRRLIIGSILFGIGWGLVGICPGPAMVLLGSGYQEGFIFVIAMLGGMGIYEWLNQR